MEHGERAGSDVILRWLKDLRHAQGVQSLAHSYLHEINVDVDSGEK